MFGFNPWVILAVFSGLVFSHTAVGIKAFNFGVERQLIKEAAVRERIHNANEEALNGSRRHIAELNALISKLEEDLRHADEEAAADPNAHRVCLGLDGVRRINRIGYSPHGR